MSESSHVDSGRASVSRREFLSASAGAVAAPLAAAALGQASASPVAAQPSPSPLRGRTRPNLLFVFTDQERYVPRWPAGLSLPGHERLARTGTTFHNHYTAATMCTSSRSVLMTGLQTADTGMFDNVDMPYVKPLPTGIPTVGRMLQQAGYYTAYKGKWHLDPAFDRAEPDRLLTREMAAYGFADYVWPGDVVGHTLGGYFFDDAIAASALGWLRRIGRPLNDEGRPWALFVSLVNPHDIMYFDADAPGERIQDTGNLLMHAARAPQHAAYRDSWDAPLPTSLKQPLNAPGRPAAHAEFERAWAYCLGSIRPEEAPWRRFTDFYFNSIRSVDTQLARILDELGRLGVAGETIVVFTSDHGELGGAHGLRGKGPFAYEEAIHVPLTIVHPDVKGGRDCRALTGHIDLARSLLGMAGLAPARVSELAGRELPGVDIGPLLADPDRAGLHAAREAVLFTYSGIATNDADVPRLIAQAKAAGQDPKSALKAGGFKPNLKKRGSLRTVFDGRHKFTRYFAPIERNRPAGLDDLYRANDVELFDLQADPGEMVNLAASREQNAALVATMSAKLEARIKAEIRVDDGREMPQVESIDWTIDSLDL